MYLGCKQTIVHYAKRVIGLVCTVFVKEKEHHFLVKSRMSQTENLNYFLLSEKEDYVNESNILLMFPAVKREGRKS